MKKLEVVCPTCKKKFSYYSSEFRPFCSEECRQIDLGLWLTESYSVPVEKNSEDDMYNLEQLINEENSSKDQ